MVRITLFLLLLLLRNNAYAWYCNFQPDSQGNIIPGSMSCSGISNDDALQNHYCGWYRPNDPYCSVYQVPVCSPQVEYQTLSCPVHQSGAINQSRSYECTSQSWTGWTTTSNNCTPDPPTCIESTETRQLTCSAGYEGLSQEQRNSICSDPYGSPIWTAWLEIYNTCKMTTTNINNPASPISPISPINPNSVISQSISNTTMTQAIEPVQELSLGTTSLQESLTTSQSSTTTTEKLQVSTSIELKPAPPEVKVETPKGKEIVPGFGLVMSMQLINASYNMQQQQVQEYINLEQENEYGRIQEFTLSLLSETNVGDRFNSLNRNRWANLLRNNPLQRLAEYD
jgi:hypothetical protein